MGNNFIYKNNLILLTNEAGGNIDSITFFARQQLFKELWIKNEVSRFKERSLWLRSALLLSENAFKIVNILVSNIDDIYKTKIDRYMKEIISYNSDFISLVWSNKEYNLICIWNTGTTWSEVTNNFLKKYIKKNTLHVDRYDLWLTSCIPNRILKASTNLNNKAFVKTLLENHQWSNPYLVPMQYILSGELSYEKVDEFRAFLSDKPYLLKLSTWAFGSQVVELTESPKTIIIKIIDKHNSMLKDKKDSSLIIAEKIEKSENKHNYISPCVLWRILDENNIFIVQASEQLFSEQNEYIWSYWNKNQEEKFFENIWKEKMMNLFKYIYSQTWYIGYIGLDFIRSKENGEYYLVWDINARMNGSDDLFFIRKMAEWIINIENIIMNDISDYDFKSLWKYKFNKNTNSWLVLLPDIEENIITKNQWIGVFINPWKNELFNEYSSLFL